MTLLKGVGHLWKEESLPSSQFWIYTVGHRKPLNVLNQIFAGSKFFSPMDNSVHSGKNGLVVGKMASMETP